MHIAHADFSGSRSLRRSLKRGLAREALAHARMDEADIPRIIATCQDLRPNAKALSRHAQRLSRMRGVVRASVAAGGIVLVLRNVRQMVSRTEGADLFAETTLFYTRLTMKCSHQGIGFTLSRASFCLHALERLVERSLVAPDRPMLSAVDGEARAVLRALAQAEVIEDGAERYLRACQSGVWAGSVDRSALEEDWGLSYGTEAAPIVVFSVRTFLGPDEMRPTLWLSWQGSSDRDRPGLTFATGD